MCGICGIYNFDRDKKVDKAEILRMSDIMIHRGPDSSGIYLERNMGLGFRRLSIIDLTTGDQPIQSEDGQVVLIANGEIYNYKELKESLLKKGHCFRTKTDVEVILHLYEEFGDLFVPKLNGMFAFAIYDRTRNYLLLARDRCGIKPLYYWSYPKGFIFASEIKSILTHKDVKIEMEENIVPEYLIFRYLSNNRTFFKGIHYIEPGEQISVQDGQIKTRPYWPPIEPSVKEEEKQNEEYLFELIEDSIKKQLMSDVPLGTLLSGGVDSSLVSALCARNQEQTINTFSVGFYEKEFDETRFAQLVSRVFKTCHHEVRVSGKEFAESLPNVIWHHDEPLNHANSVQIYLICKYAKDFVKVLLTGEGADELFGGYPRYFIVKWQNRFAEFPSVVRNVLLGMLSVFGEKRIEKLSETFRMAPIDGFIINSAFVRFKQIQDLFWGRELTFPGRMAVLEEVQKQQQGSILSSFFRFEQKTYMLSILNRQDKMSMGASIESRVPFLDNNMINFANSLKIQQRLNLFRSKHILKKTAETILPRRIAYRPKCGFSVPVNKWLQNKEGLGRYLEMTLDKINSIPDINIEILRRLILEHKNGLANHAEILWPVINFVLWHDIFISNSNLKKMRRAGR